MKISRFNFPMDLGIFRWYQNASSIHHNNRWTANVGGNTISFHLSGFDLVHSIEKDALTAEILSQNLRAYQLPTQNIHCCDYLSIYEELDQDVVFF